jgi:WD40 repeat protein/transcriptional regulator with XRE-family HTH domain
MDRPSAFTSRDAFATFGDLLKYLRRRERLTQLELSIAVGYSEAQISRLEKNQRLPDIAALKALFIPALHLQDEPALAARLLELAQSARQLDSPTPGIPPYKGLLFFHEDDAGLFFGREALTERLVEHVEGISLDASSRILTVVGASGSGKSSLVRAGLAVALRQAGWNVRIFTPTANPMQLLKANLEAARASGLGRMLLLVDQFEEVFTLCHDEPERTAFIDRLIGLAQTQGSNTTVVIALRADFYSHCAQYPLLRQALAAEQEYIGQMTAEELRRAIEEPARSNGWELEPGLVEVLLQDVSARGAQEPEPGALPLLSHALLATWERRRGRMVTLDGYYASGGVRGAIAETAENVFTDQLNRAQQEIARDVFVRLTELGQGTEDTRRRASLNELVRQADEAAQLRAVLNTLAEARLITLNEDNAEVAHEALIREWQRLHEWLTLNRESLLLHRHLTESAYEWEARGRDPAELYRGARLAQAREWAAGSEAKMNTVEEAFLATSTEQEEQEAGVREAQRRRELEAAKALAEAQHRTAQQLRRRAIVLFGVLVFAVITAVSAGILADRSSTLAEENASIARVAQAASTRAIADFTRSEAQRLAADARSLMQSASDPQLIALLALRSISTQYTGEGDIALTGAAALPLPKQILVGHRKGVYSVNFSPDGKQAVTGSYDGVVRLFDTQTGAATNQFTANETERGVEGVFSPDGRTIYAASNDGTVWAWDVETGRAKLRLRYDDAPIDIVVSPDGTRLLIGSFAGIPRLLDAQSGEVTCRFVGHTGPVWELAFSPDARYVATSSLDKTARLWNAENCDLVRTFRGHTEGVASVDFSPDGKYLATGGWDRSARLWEVETGQELRQFVGHTCYLVKSVRFSPDGKYLLTGACDKTARLWDVETGDALYTLDGHADQLWSVAFSNDGQHILTGSHDSSAWLWDLRMVSGEHPRFVGHTDSIWGVAISPDNRLLATSGGGRSTRLWDMQTGQVLYTFPMNDVNSVAFSPDGHFLLFGAGDSSVGLWNIQTKRMVKSFAHDPVRNAMVTGVAYSSDGRYALTSGQDGHARRWDLQTGELLTTYGVGTDNPGGPDSLYGVAYSSDGRHVLTGSWDSVMRLYDAETGEELRKFTEGGMGSIYGVAFSPDSRLALSGSKDGIARLWDVQTGQVLKRLTGHAAYLYAAIFSPDGKFALTTSADNTARLWDLDTGQELRRFMGHKGPVEWAAFSPDGATFVTGSEDGTARMWSVDRHDTMNYLCSHLLRDFTAEEREQYHILDGSPTCPGEPERPSPAPLSH